MATTVEDLVEITSALDADLVHIRVVDGNQDNKMTMENFIKLLPSIQTPVGDYIFSALSEDRTAEGLFIWAFDNAISQANYPALWNKLGHIFNEQHASAGDADLSASGTLFYPTPIPGGYQRIGTPDTAIINSTDDVNDSTELITLATADYDALHMTRGVLGTGADGVPVRLKLVSGALPTGLSEDTTYFVKFKTTPDIELYTTEADAISSGTTNRVNLTDAVGTFKLTQEGIALDDAMQGHEHETGFLDGNATQSGSDNRTNANSPGADTEGIVDDGINEPPRITNETRPKTFISFGYIKAEHVTVAGEPISALRDSQDWVEFTGDWRNKEFIITPAGAIGYSDIDDVYDLQIEIWLADDDTPTNPIKMIMYTKVFDSSSPSNISNDTGFGIMPNDSLSFKIQTGASGLYYLSETGAEKYLGGSDTAAYKVIITKPNLVATYADTSFRKVYDISDATDVIHTLPDASTQLTEQIIKRRGSGAGKVIMATVSGQTIEGLTASIWELEGEGTIVLFPSGGNWEVKEYSDYDNSSNDFWKKYKEGTLKQWSFQIAINDGSTYTFLRTFIDADYLSTWSDAENNDRLTALHTKTATNGVLRVVNNSGSSVNLVLGEHISTGRWRT